MKVSLMVTCLGDALFPDVGRRRCAYCADSAWKWTFRRRKPVAASRTSTALLDEARGLARHTIRTFSGSKRWSYRRVVRAMVKLEYPELFHDEPA